MYFDGMKQPYKLDNLCTFVSVEYFLFPHLVVSTHQTVVKYVRFQCYLDINSIWMLT